MKSCGWEILDVSISNIGSTNELFSHYGKITLSDIKTQAEIINADNDRREQEDDQLYTCLMASLTP